MPFAAPVTVVIPCCNEEAGLPSLLSRLTALQSDGGSGWQMLFVDDGSTDRTFSGLLSAARALPWVKVLRHGTNLGLGAALRTAFQHTSSPIICTIDSDCTYPPEQLPRLVSLIRQGADIATASAWHPESARPEGGRFRIMLSRGASRIYKRLIGQDVHTFTCLFRAYRRDVLDRIRFRANGFAAVAEIMLRGMLDGYRVGELPMRLESRRFGASKLKIGDAVVAHAALLSMTTALITARRARMMLGYTT